MTFNLNKIFKTSLLIFFAFIVSLTVSLAIFNINGYSASETLESLNVLDIKCLFPSPSLNCGGSSLTENLLSFFQIAALPLAVVVITWGGYQYLMGSVDGKSDGKKAIMSAIIGLVIVTLGNFAVTLIFRGGNGAPALIGTGGTLNPEGLIKFLEIIKNFFVTISIVVAIVAMMWSGYKFFFSSLDWEKETGIKGIRNSGIGLVVIFLASSVFDLAKTTGASIAASNTLGQIKADGKNGGLDVLGDQIFIPLLTNASNILITLSSVVAIIVVIYSGYKYFFAGADWVKEDGLKGIRNGTIGLIVVLTTKVILTTIDSVFVIRDAVTNKVTTPLTFADGAFVGLRLSTFLNLVRAIIGGIAIPISSAVALFFLVLGGWFWITSNGDTKQIEKAQNAIKNAIIGLIVLLLATTITSLVTYFAVNVKLS